MKVKITVFGEVGGREIISLAKPVITVGGCSSYGLWLLFAGPCHQRCQLRRTSDELKLRDLLSRNGTYLNDRRINEAVVNTEDCRQVEPASLVLQIDCQTAKSKTHFERLKRIYKQPSTGALFVNDIDITNELSGPAFTC